MVIHAQVEHIFLIGLDNLEMSALHALLVNTVNFLDRLMQLDLAVQDSCAEVGPNLVHLMIQVTHTTGLVLLDIIVKKGQQMALCALKEHSGHSMVPNLAVTVCRAVEGSIVTSLGC